ARAIGSRRRAGTPWRRADRPRRRTAPPRSTPRRTLRRSEPSAKARAKARRAGLSGPRAPFPAELAPSPPCPARPRIAAGLRDAMESAAGAEGGRPAPLRVRVAGGGPAGLGCAIGLARQGHEVDVFERLDAPLVRGLVSGSRQ
ncbi:unnamed protein product, partial [Prorocentrum cordatum]